MLSRLLLKCVIQSRWFAISVHRNTVRRLISLSDENGWLLIIGYSGLAYLFDLDVSGALTLAPFLLINVVLTSGAVYALKIHDAAEDCVSADDE